MQNQQIRICGAIVFWSLSDRTRRAVLKDHWEAAGFTDQVPEPRAKSAALKDALIHVFADKKGDFEVERLKEANCFEVSAVQRGDFATGNSRSSVLKARFNEVLNRIEFKPYTPDPCDEIVEAYNEGLGMLVSAQVSHGMVSVLRGLRATTLRPTGGMYWLPEEQLGQWQKAVEGVEQAGNNRCYLVRTPKDADTVRAVRDAVAAECQAEARRLETEINELIETAVLIESEGGKKRRQETITRRKAEYDAILQKLTLYEDLLGVGFEAVKDAVARCQVGRMQADFLDQEPVGAA